MKLLNDQGLRYEEIQFLTRPYRTVFLASLMLGGIGATRQCCCYNFKFR